MPKVNHLLSLHQKRERRVRAKLHGTAERPRLTVYRSNKAMYLQVINDDLGNTLAACSTVTVEAKKGMTKIQKSEAAAADLAAKLKKTDVKKLVFDRGGYRYHGRVKAVADAIRAQGFEL